eukprot:1909821-Prymnesium_polylepis.2
MLDGLHRQAIVLNTARHQPGAGEDVLVEHVGDVRRRVALRPHGRDLDKVLVVLGRGLEPLRVVRLDLLLVRHRDVDLVRRAVRLLQHGLRLHDHRLDRAASGGLDSLGGRLESLGHRGAQRRQAPGGRRS